MKKCELVFHRFSEKAPTRDQVVLVVQNSDFTGIPEVTMCSEYEYSPLGHLMKIYNPIQCNVRLGDNDLWADAEEIKRMSEITVLQAWSKHAS